MRDCFRRELQLRNKEIMESPKIRRKYFDQMLFLIPTIRDRATCSNYPPMQEENKEDKREGNEYEENTCICGHANNSVLWCQQRKKKNVT
jgi:hypothetical protein